MEYQTRCLKVKARPAVVDGAERMEVTFPDHYEISLPVLTFALLFAPVPEAAPKPPEPEEGPKTKKGRKK